MNYFDYTSNLIPKGEDGWLAQKFNQAKSYFKKDEPTSSWDRQTGSVVMDGKTYSTSNRDDVTALQNELINKGYNLGVSQGNGNFGKNTQAALTRYISGSNPNPIRTTQSSAAPQAQSDPSMLQNVAGTVRSWFQKDPKDSWDQNAGTVTIGGKTYNTNNRSEVAALQDYLIGQGHNLGVAKGTGTFGKNTQAVLNQMFSKNDMSSDNTPFGMKVIQAVNAGTNNITGNPGVHAVATAIPGMYHKYIVNPTADFISEHVNEKVGEGLRRMWSVNPGVRTNVDITPVEQKIYNSIGNYLIKNNRSGLDTRDINNWYRTEGKQLMADLGHELPEDWRYSKNDLGWETKLFNPLEKIMNVNGRMSLERDDDGNYYFTDVYDHNKSSYISDKHIDNSASQDQKNYLGVVKWLQNNAHPSDADPNYQKHSTRIQIYS